MRLRGCLLCSFGRQQLTAERSDKTESPTHLDTAGRGDVLGLQRPAQLVDRVVPARTGPVCLFFCKWFSCFMYWHVVRGVPAILSVLVSFRLSPGFVPRDRTCVAPPCSPTQGIRRARGQCAPRRACSSGELSTPSPQSSTCQGIIPYRYRGANAPSRSSTLLQHVPFSKKDAQNNCTPLPWAPTYLPSASNRNKKIKKTKTHLRKTLVLPS